MAERAKLEEAEVIARRVGRLIGARMPPGWGFALVLSSFDEGGFCTYVSNVERGSCVGMLRELVEKIERGEPEA